ncbi:MAG: GNAT family N-acetyltransferase [Vulcanimicrobiota bacterium]
MKIREARREDLEEMIALYRQKEHFFSVVRNHSVDEYTEYFVGSLRQYAHLIGTDKDLKVFLAHDDKGEMTGYLILFLNLTEAITGERQALIYDYALKEGEDAGTALSALLSGACEAAAHESIEYNIVEIDSRDIRGSQLFSERGFTREINRIIRRATKHTFPDRENDPYRVRKAVNTDLFFFLVLNSKCGLYTMLPGRGASKEEVASRYLETYSRILLEGDEFLIPLVIEEKETFKPIGYLMYKTNSCDSFTGDPIAYIYDLAVDPAYWGKRVTQRIMREGESLLVDMGFVYIIGDISESNQRALKTAMKSLGYSLESVRWVKKIR